MINLVAMKRYEDYISTRPMLAQVYKSLDFWSAHEIANRWALGEDYFADRKLTKTEEYGDNL